MDFQTKRRTLIGIITTGLHYIDDAEVLELLSKMASNLYELWGGGSRLYDKREEQEFGLLLSVLPSVEGEIEMLKKSQEWFWFTNRTWKFL